MVVPAAHHHGYREHVGVVQVVTAVQYADLAGVTAQSAHRWITRHVKAGDDGFWNSETSPNHTPIVAVSRAAAALTERGAALPEWDDIAMWVPVAGAGDPAPASVMNEMRARLEGATLETSAFRDELAARHVADLERRLAAANAEIERLRAKVNILAALAPEREEAPR